MPIAAGLRSIFGDRKTGELTAIGAEFRNPVDHGDGQHGLRIRRPRARKKSVASISGSRATVSDAFVIPIVAAVVGIQLPIVTRGVVAAVAVKWAVQVVQLAVVAWATP